MAALPLVLISLLSYLVGSIPFGYLVGRWRGVDIMKQGSGNIGATNVGRVLGRPFGILVFLLDFAKGAGPALTAQQFASTHQLELPPDSLPVAAAVAAFLGHLFPIYLRFRGGKGVATAAGAVSVLLPGPASAGLLTWLVVVLASRYVSLASLVAAVVLCVFRLLLTPQPWNVQHRILTLFCLIAASLIFLRHRANISRLLHGNENRLKETPAMLHFSKILHVLALGLWFGTVIFFSFVVGLNLFGTFEQVAAAPPEERPIWLPMWQRLRWFRARARPDVSRTAAQGARDARRRRGHHAVISLVFRHPGVCARCWQPRLLWPGGAWARDAFIAFAPAFCWRRSSRWHWAGGWSAVVDDLRGPRNSTFDAMVSHSPPRDEDIRSAVEARRTFGRWHLYSLGVNMVTVLLVTVAMAQAASLPIAATEDKTTRG